MRFDSFPGGAEGWRDPVAEAQVLWSGPTVALRSPGFPEVRGVWRISDVLVAFGLPADMADAAVFELALALLVAAIQRSGMPHDPAQTGIRIQHFYIDETGRLRSAFAALCTMVGGLNRVAALPHPISRRVWTHPPTKKGR